MAYYVPLRTIKVGPDFCIPVHRIVLIGTVDTYSMQKLVSEHKKAKTLISCTGRLPTKTVIILDNGSVITSPYTLNKIKNNINKMQSDDLKDNFINIAKEKRIIRDKEIDVEAIMNELEDIENGEGEEEEGTEAEEDD